MQNVWVNESGETLDGRLRKLLESRRLLARFICTGEITTDVVAGASSLIPNGGVIYVRPSGVDVYSLSPTEERTNPSHSGPV